MKKISFLLLVALMVFNLVGIATANNDVTVKVNENRISFPDQKPIIENNRTLVPIRFVAEALGAEVNWNNKNRTVTVIKNGETILLQINNKNVQVGKSSIQLDVPATIKNNRTLVPLRFISEILGTTVEWDVTTKTINISTNDSKAKERVFNIEAKETHWMFNEEIMDMTWTYNGTLPGQEIRVQERDKVVLKLKNSLSVPTALHLHGFPVPNEMDGIPGVTQNAIMPGEEFVYEYTADIPGTYWYHSHQNGAEQVGKGLYGVFIVEPKDKKEYDLDQVIFIDEWASMGDMDMDMGMGMDNMDHGNMDMDMDNAMDNSQMDGESDVSHAEDMNEMYDTMLINGKAAPAIESIMVEEGDTIKLRFLNAGLFTQVVSIPGHSFKVTHYDGQAVNEPEQLSNVSFRIAPAERYDVEIDIDQPGSWGIQIFAEENKENLQAILPILYKGYESQAIETVDSITSYLDITTYGEPKEIQIGDITKEFEMILGTNDGGETFTINNKQFPNHEIYEIEEGDVVKFTITNETDVDHPMHMHGEFFYVLSRNGQPIQGSPVLKDTLNVKPNETYEVVFVAKNSGNWLFHCHEFHHASGGMVAEIKYKGYKPKFTIDPNVPNQPE